MAALAASSEVTQDEIYETGYRWRFAANAWAISPEAVGRKFVLSRRYRRLDGKWHDTRRDGGRRFQAEAQMKLDDWHEGVTEESVKEAIARYVDSGIINGNVRIEQESVRVSIAIAAGVFFREFHRKIILLSDGRQVYFAPDPKNKERGLTNSECWAIYAIHAVTHGRKKVPKGQWRERIWSPEKVDSLLRIEGIIRQEKCSVRIDKDDKERDSILFHGEDADGNHMVVSTRLDEFGNVNADITEVTTVMAGEGPLEEPSSPLSEAVAEVAIHQADGYSRATLRDSTSNAPEVKRKVRRS